MEVEHFEFELYSLSCIEKKKKKLVNIQESKNEAVRQRPNKRGGREKGMW